MTQELHFEVFDLWPTFGSLGELFILDFDLSYKMRYRKNSFAKCRFQLYAMI